MKRADEWCDECDDRDLCDVLERCRIERDGEKPLSECTPAEVLDIVCPNRPLPPRPTKKGEAA